MTAQIWLWAVLSGLGIGIAGWWIRGWQASGRELRMKRVYEARLCAVEEDAKRLLSRAREEAAEDRRRLEAAHDALYERLTELDDPEAAALAVRPMVANGNGNGKPEPDLAPPGRSRRPGARNGKGATESTVTRIGAVPASG